MGWGLIPAPPPPTYFVAGAALTGAGAAYVANQAVNGVPGEIYRDSRRIPITTVRQGSNVPAIVRSHPPGEGISFPTPTRSGK